MTDEQKKRGGRRKGAGRPRTGGVQVSIWLPDWIKAELDKATAKDGTTVSQTIVRALERKYSRAKREGDAQI